jgi:hypothetical protein
LQFLGQTTAALAYNASAAQVQAALQALPNIGSNSAGTSNVTCTGGALPTAVTITFANNLAGLPQPLITALSSLTGGTAVITRTTAGAPITTYYGSYVNGDATFGNPLLLLPWGCTVLPNGQMNIGPQDIGEPYPFTTYAYASGTFKAMSLVGLDAFAVSKIGRLILGTINNLAAPNALLRLGV